MAPSQRCVISLQTLPSNVEEFTSDPLRREEINTRSTMDEAYISRLRANNAMHFWRHSSNAYLQHQRREVYDLSPYIRLGLISQFPTRFNEIRVAIDAIARVYFFILSYSAVCNHCSMKT